MHQIEHLAENSGRSAKEVAETMRKNGTYGLLEEEIARGRALDFLVENAAPVRVPEEEEATPEEETEAAGATAGVSAQAETTKGEE
jgi:trigger factor